jgi:capsule biosynthesis phosphatase
MKIKIRKKKVFCFDIDNVICLTKKNNYKNSKPINKNINIINKLKSEGHIIKIFTARYMGRNLENVTKAKKQGYKITEKQLKKWNVNYDKLIFGKPSFDIYIDDKNFGFKSDWSKKIKKTFKL